MLPYEREAEESISTNLASEFAAMARLHNAAVTLFDGWTLPASGADRVTVYTVAGLFAKACKTYRAIEHVCGRGLGQDAAVLARSLYETAIAILFLLQKRGLERQRIALYQANTLNAGLRMLDEWRKTPGLKRKAGKALIAGLRAERDVWIARLPAGTNHKKHWSGLWSIEEAAGALRGKVTYQAFYRFASPFAHAADMTAHVYLDDTGAFTVKLGPGDEHLGAIMAFAHVVLWSVASRINRRYRLGSDSVLKAERTWSSVTFKRAPKAPGKKAINLPLDFTSDDAQD